MKKICWSTLLLATTCLSSASAHAQYATQGVASDQPGHAFASDALNKLISVDLEGISVKQAVKVLAAKGRVRITFQEERLDAASAPITLHVKQLPLGTALDRVLLGTGLRVEQISEDLINIRLGDSSKPAQGGITGKIVDAKTKLPLSGVTVLLDATTKGTISANDGSFRFNNVDAGRHTVRLRLLGYVKVAQTVTVEEGQFVSLTVALEPSLNALDQVTVTGSVVAAERRSISTPITVITAKDIERLGINSMIQLLRGQIPGVFAVDNGTQDNQGGIFGGDRANIYVRGTASFGGDANPLKTYVDGVEILDPAYIATIDMNSVERIEVITGPQAATVYGSGAMGGVLQVFTKRGSQSGVPEIKMTLKFGTLQNNLSSGKAPIHNHSLDAAGGLGASLTYALNTSYKYSGQWQPGLTSRSLGFSGGVFTQNGPLTANLNIMSASGQRSQGNNPQYGILELISSGVFPPGYNLCMGIFSKKVNENSNQNISLNGTYRVGSRITNRFTIGRNLLTTAATPSDAKYCGGVTVPVGSDSLVTFSQSTGLRTSWSYGSDFMVSSSRLLSTTMSLGASGSWGSRFSASYGAVNAKSRTFTNPSISQSLGDKSWGAYSQWRFKIFDRINFDAAIRLEQNPNYGGKVKFDFTPTNGLSYVIDVGDVSLKLMGSYGRATREPPYGLRDEIMSSVDTRFDPSSYVSNLANPNLVPERSSGPQGGFELYYGNRGTLKLNRYRQKVKDLIQGVVVDSVARKLLSIDSTTYALQWMNVNTGDILQEGWESTMTLNIWRFGLGGTYSWNAVRVLYWNPATRISSGVENANSAIAISQPSHTGSSSVSYAHGGTSISLNTNFSGRKVCSCGVSGIKLHDTRLSSLDEPRKDYTKLYSYTAAAYAKSNLSISHRISRNTTLVSNIDNIGNTFTSDEGTKRYPTLGRQANFGLSMRF